eukprot:gene7785-biopygen16585
MTFRQGRQEGEATADVDRTRAARHTPIPSEIHSELEHVVRPASGPRPLSFLPPVCPPLPESVPPARSGTARGVGGPGFCARPTDSSGGARQGRTVARRVPVRTGGPGSWEAAGDEALGGNVGAGAIAAAEGSSEPQLSSQRRPFESLAVPSTFFLWKMDDLQAANGRGVGGSVGGNMRGGSVGG